MHRMFNWLVFDVLLGLIPVATVWTMQTLAGAVLHQQGYRSVLDSELPEILFLVIVLNVTAVRDLQSARLPPDVSGASSVLISSQIVSALVCGMLYAGIRFARILNPDVSVPSLWRIAMLLTAVFFLVALASQLLIAKHE